jgi:toxin ParE1/3/4
MSFARLGALAEQDLIDIWQYTEERWGPEQADAYLDAIEHGFQRLVYHPEAGTNRDNVREGYRVLFIQQHAVYYRVTPTGVHVVRVLHGRMDPLRHV